MSTFPVDPVWTPYLDRQASELEYHARVLALARDTDRPLLDRLRSLQFFTTLTDEFFRVRLADVVERDRAGVTERSRAGHTPSEELALLRQRYAELADEQRRTWTTDLQPALAKAGVHLRRWGELDEEQQAVAARVFEEKIFPILTPLAVGPAHPFPFISDLSLSLGVVLAERPGEPWFVRIKVPALLDRLVAVTDTEDEDVFVPVEDVIGAHLSRLVPGREVLGWHTFRVTRNADYDVEAGEDLRDAVTSEIFERRFGRIVRLELDEHVPDHVRDMLCEALEIPRRATHEVDSPLDLSLVKQLTAVDRPDLRGSRWRPVEVPGFSKDVFAKMRQGDILVHHPYESFAGTTQRFIEQAASDPKVLAIKMTLYRTSGDSPIVHALIRAAKAGKQVVALIELKARFDEEANIRWSRQLEEAGVHVVYGFVELKTHTKTVLVVRQDTDQIRRYAHIATGNYNPATATVYEDIGLFTADPAITSDFGELFNMLTGHSRRLATSRILVAPTNLTTRVIELIEQQARPGGRIVIKVNGITHAGVIDALEAASQAGASIDLIIRSISCLRPGVPGLSDGIRVRSKVGGFLEHSRVYKFGDDPLPGGYLVGSADLMTRNLENRVESMVPVDGEGLRERLDEMLDLLLQDDVSSWTLSPDGSWQRVPTTEGIDAQAILRERALASRDRSAPI